MQLKLQSTYQQAVFKYIAKFQINDAEKDI